MGTARNLINVQTCNVIRDAAVRPATISDSMQIPNWSTVCRSAFVQKTIGQLPGRHVWIPAAELAEFVWPHEKC